MHIAYGCVLKFRETSQFEPLEEEPHPSLPYLHSISRPSVSPRLQCLSPACLRATGGDSEAAAVGAGHDVRGGAEEVTCLDRADPRGGDPLVLGSASAGQEVIRPYYKDPTITGAWRSCLHVRGELSSRVGYNRVRQTPPARNPTKHSRNGVF